jgi:hypothetical protein
MTPLEFVVGHLLHSLIFTFAAMLAAFMLVFTLSMAVSERRTQARIRDEREQRRRQHQLDADRHATWIRNKRMTMR